jgi:hypothetical protein
MATLTVQDINRTGITPTYAAAAGGGDQFANNGRTFTQIKNTSGGNITVTFVTQTTIDGLSVTDLTVVVPLTSGDKMTGPFPPDIYNDANGFLQMTYSGVTNLTVGAFRLS